MSEGRMTAEQTPDIERFLYEHREDALTCFDHEGYGVWCCICGEHGLTGTWREHVAQALVPVLAAAVREARAAELREAADEFEHRRNGPHSLEYVVARWLRDRADRIAVDAPEGGEGR